IDAPEFFLRDPAVKAFADQSAPPAAAAFHTPENAGLQLRRDRAFGIGLGAQRKELFFVAQRDDRGAAPGQERVIDPTLRSLGVADAPPVLVFAGDLDR